MVIIIPTFRPKRRRQRRSGLRETGGEVRLIYCPVLAALPAYSSCSMSLLGKIEGLVKGNSLLIVTSGPLARLPFQVLLTAAP